MTKEIVDELIQLYQKAIEYYSALNDPKYDTYLQKVRKLLSDEVILDVLSGKPPPKKVEIKPLENKTVREFEDLEIWPSGPPGGLDSLSPRFEEKKNEIEVEEADDNEGDTNVTEGRENIEDNEEKKISEEAEDKNLEENAKEDDIICEKENEVKKDQANLLEENKEEIAKIEKSENIEITGEDNIEEIITKKVTTENEIESLEVESILNEEKPDEVKAN